MHRDLRKNVPSFLSQSFNSEVVLTLLHDISQTMVAI